MKHQNFRSIRPARRCAAVACVALAAYVALTAAAAGETDEAGFERIFDGRSLVDWQGQDMSFWSVEDDAITGTITPTHAPDINQYLVWQGGLIDDFELKLSFRLTGSTTGNTNGGFQFRSRRLPHGDVAGYQVDNNFGQPWKVRLYDEFGRHDLALEGEQTVFTREGKKETSPLVLEPGARDFRLDEWHEYHLIAQGRQLALRINGRLVALVDDQDDDSAEAAGVLAMQLHTGPPMKAQFKDIRLKRLPMKEPLSPRARLLAEAAFHWDFGERLDAHQPPFKPIGQVTAGVLADGPGAAAGTRVTRFSPGGLDAAVDFNQPKLWNIPNGQAFTLLIRLRPAEDGWASTWLSKGGGAAAHFRIRGVNAAGRAEPGVQFDFGSAQESGGVSVTVPVGAADLHAWQEWVVRYDGHTFELWRNGTTQSLPRRAIDLKPDDSPFYIGTEIVDGAPAHLFSGDIAEIAVWARALTVEELSACSPVFKYSPARN